MQRLRLPLLVVAVVFVVSASVFVPAADALLVTNFPHYQTFDSWQDCYYIGTCYELYCNNIQGGWYNPEFHPPCCPYTEEVRGWWVKGGPTTSNLDNQQNYWPCPLVQTGPCSDHTSGAADTGKYLYAEASACFGYKFRVRTPTILFTNANASFSFYYYMYGIDLHRSGQTIGYLQARMSLDNGTSWIPLFNRTGEVQDNSTQPWGFYSTILDSLFPYTPSTANPLRVDFMFEARTGGDRQVSTFWKSDIAIDDVLWTQEGASTVLVPYIDPPTNGTDGSTEGGGDGISGGEIAGIVVGVIGGLAALCCCLLLLLLLLLLLISPRKPQQAAQKLRTMTKALSKGSSINSEVNAGEGGDGL